MQTQQKVWRLRYSLTSLVAGVSIIASMCCYVLKPEKTRFLSYLPGMPGAGQSYPRQLTMSNDTPVGLEKITAYKDTDFDGVVDTISIEYSVSAKVPSPYSSKIQWIAEQLGTQTRVRDDTPLFKKANELFQRFIAVYNDGDMHETFDEVFNEK